MAKIGKKPTDDQLLEGGGGGGGGFGISGTKYSKMPSLRGSSSTMGDLRKINKDTSNLRGNAKKVTEDAQDRAAARTGIRAAGAGAAAAGIKTAVSDDSEDKKDDKTSSRAGMGEIISGKGMAGGGMTEDDKKAAQYRKEAKSGGTDAPVPPSVTQEATDKKMQDKAKQAPTTKTDMGKPFARAA